jgi:hypothetical protein
MHHGIAQPKGVNLVVDHRFTAPARRTASQVSFAVTVGIKQSGNFGIFKLVDTFDFVLLGGLLIDQIPLRRAGNKSPSR